MSVGASGAMAGLAASQAAQANAAARRAELAECRTVVVAFDSHTATTEQQIQYADCVRMLHPRAMSDGEEAVAKALFIVALTGGALGARRAWCDSWCDWTDVGIWTFVGFFGAPLVAIFAAGVVAGVVWLFQ